MKEKVESDFQGFKRSHPAYASIKISRVSGSTNLFDSSFKHQHFIALSIHHATKRGDAVHESVHAEKELLEVWMSESQFARAITSMNMGSGSPCTLVHHGGESVPSVEPEDIVKKHEYMVQDKLKGVLDAQLGLSQQLKKWREEKHRPTLKELGVISKDMGLIAANFESNMGFYAQCIEEHTEEIVDDAKTEIETHILATSNRLGISKDALPQLGVS